MICCGGRKRSVTFVEQVRQTMHKSHQKSLKHPSYVNRCILYHLPLHSAPVPAAMYLTSPSTVQHTSASSHRHCGCRILCTLFEIHNYDALTEADKQFVKWQFCMFHVFNRLSTYNLNIFRKENPYILYERLRGQIQKKILQCGVTKSAGCFCLDSNNFVALIQNNSSHFCFLNW
jgi:hypothetical protein